VLMRPALDQHREQMLGDLARLPLMTGLW
jgi:hypothetical protein